MVRSIGWIVLFAVLVVGIRCASTQNIESVGDLTSVEELDSAAYRIELGKRLFYDPIMSRDSSVSCATCHKQELAFTDGLPKSIGIRGEMVTRNSPTLTNVGNRKHLLLDGVNPSLESQVGVPIQEHSEFDFNFLLLIDRLQRNKEYVALAQKAYGEDFSKFVIQSAIASFERTLISENSPYDDFVRGNTDALDASQKRGMHLFFEELYCAQCHNGIDFTNERFTNNGLYAEYADNGRMRLTSNPVDQGIFRVPTLRNVAVTAPYMHDGSVNTLMDVVRHYESGGRVHPGKAREIQPFELTNQQREDLVHFLEALTDSTFLTNPEFGVIH